jgi:uncharacterized protein YbjT (DUF2867 family)
VKVLVTGGTGFVGPKIVRAIGDQGHDVRALVRDRSRGQELEARGVELAEGDVTDAASVRRAVAGTEVVVHLVAILQGKPEDFDRIMVRGTEHMVEAAREAGVQRFVLMSALGTTEQTKDVVPYYGAKWAMEQAVLGSGLEHVIFRPSFVFAPDGGALALFARVARFSPLTPVIGDQRIQPIWIEDVAAFFAKAVNLRAAANRTWEIGGPDVVDWAELYKRIKRVLGIRRPNVRVPFALARVNAAVIEALPGPTPINRDQVKMLAAGDNTCDVGPAVEAFDQTLLPLDEQLRRGLLELRPA